MFKHIGQNLLIAGLGVLTILLTLLLILELIPVGVSALEVEQKISVSSSPINVTDKTYVSAISGIMSNPTNDAVRVESFRVTVSNEDGDRKLVELDGCVMPPRTSYELEQIWEGVTAYDAVIRVEAVVGGEILSISNSESEVDVGGLSIIYAALLLLSVGFLIHACKIRYYMYQEDRAGLSK